MVGLPESPVDPDDPILYDLNRKPYTLHLDPGIGKCLAVSDANTALMRIYVNSTLWWLSQVLTMVGSRVYGFALYKTR